MCKGKVFIYCWGSTHFPKKRSNKSKGRKNVWHGNWHVWNAKCKCLPYCCYMTNLEICGLPHTVEICDCLFSSNATTAADDMKNLHKTPPGWTSQPIFGHQMFCYFFLFISFFYSYYKKKLFYHEKQNDMKNLHETPPGWTSQPIFGH